MSITIEEDGGEEGDNECEAGWCPRQENLLKRWAEKAAGYRWLHDFSRLHFKRQNDWLSYPAIIIASITGVGGFAVLSPSDNDPDAATQRRITSFQYFFASLNVLSGILTSISKFSNCDAMVEQHSNMCVAWSKFYRQIDMELSLERKNRVPMLAFLGKMRKDYDQLLDEHVDIPAVAIAAFNRKFNGDESFAKPDVCNGLSIITHEMEDVRPRARKSSNWLSLKKFVVGKRRSLDTLDATNRL